MDSIAHFFDRADEDAEVGTPRINRRILRDKSNPMDISNQEFKRFYRINKEAFLYLLKIVDEKCLTTARISSIPSILKLAAALRFLADGSYQVGTGQDSLISFAQPTISQNLCQILNIFEEEICPRWICFQTNPTTQNANKEVVFQKFGIPGVIGCVDGTHIRILKPSRDPHTFINRKNYFSINAMIVCDHNMRILSVDGRYGGASHDSMVWRMSNLRNYLQETHSTSTRRWLLRDAGYPLEPWLITPFRSTSEGSREAFLNTKHASARNVVERTIGLLKNRFRCIIGERQLHYHPQKVVQILNTCCALHNICLHYNINSDLFMLPVNEEVEGPNDGATHSTSSLGGNESNEATGLTRFLL